MLIYHSPSGSDASFIRYLEKSIDKALISDSVVIMGDFNIDMKINGYIQDKLMKTMNSVGLKQLVKEVTRITSTSETIIDLVFSNIDFDIEVSESKIMDHSEVVLIWNKKEAKERSKRIICGDYKRMDVKFKILIEINVDVNEGDSINEKARRMIDSIVKCIDIVAPRKLIVIKNKLQEKQ